MTNETLNAIFSRRSNRNFKPDPVPQNILTTILTAGQSAPYVTADSRHFSVMLSRDVIARLSEAAKKEAIEINGVNGGMFSAPGFDGTYGAPTVIVVSGNETAIQYEAVCAAAVQNMLIAAESLGLASCWAYFPIFAFYGAESGMWREELRIPDGYRPCAAVLLGYSLEGQTKDADTRYKNAISYIPPEAGL